MSFSTIDSYPLSEDGWSADFSPQEGSITRDGGTSLRTKVRAPALLFGALLLLGAPIVRGQGLPTPPERMSYQGFLTDGNGVALGLSAPKNYDVIFGIWSDQSAGTNLWAEQQTVTVDKGYFSVLLGEGAAVGAPHDNLSTLFARSDASERYVEFTVKGIGSGSPPADVKIQPRLKLLTSPYAFLATKAISSVTASNVDGGALTSGTIASARLSSNVALLDRSSQVFTNANTFAKTLQVGSRGMTDNQVVNLRVVGNDGATWKGGAAFGNSNAAVVVGELSGVATIGAHNATLSAWGNLALNPGGSVGVGTSNPQAAFHAYSTGWPVEIVESGNTVGTWLSLRNDSSGGHNWNLISSGSGNGEGTGKLLLNDQTSGGTVLMAETAPANKVTVNGNLAVTGSLLNGTNAYASGPENLRIVRGHISGGNIASGQGTVVGWSVTGGNGIYTITFSQGTFSEIPAITVTPISGGAVFASLGALQVNSFALKTYTISSGSVAPVASDFFFIAVGPHP